MYGLILGGSLSLVIGIISILVFASLLVEFKKKYGKKSYWFITGIILGGILAIIGGGMLLAVGVLYWQNREKTSMKIDQQTLTFENPSINKGMFRHSDSRTNTNQKNYADMLNQLGSSVGSNSSFNQINFDDVDND
jgi:hypothetical protein